MENKQEPKISTGLAVRTKLVAGYTCFDKLDVDAVNKCINQFDDRLAKGINLTTNLQERRRCWDSC